jgi:uncharacterized membrane protein YfcA
MDMFSVFFPVSGVTTSIFSPPLVAFLVSVVCSLGGLSGAFILLPFQMSVLGFTSPAVSATNFVYNIVATPSGAYRYFKEGRMAWPLAWVIITGILPGIFIGYYVRILYLPNPRIFKLFVGVVLLSIGVWLVYQITGRSQAFKSMQREPDDRFAKQATLDNDRKHARIGSGSGLPSKAVVKTIMFSLKTVEYEFWGERFRFSVPAMFLLALVVGMIGGAYGIGGGVIIAPFCVTVFRLPIYTVAGPALLSTFFTSIVGVFFYSVLPAAGGVSTSPDWPLGFLFGIGGFAGMYIGAPLQKYISQNLIKLMLGIIIIFLAVIYIAQYFIE